MAKTSLIQRELKRTQLVAKYAKKHAELKTIASDLKKGEEERAAARLALQKLPRNVTIVPIGTPSRILKPAIAFFDLVTTGFWPAILVRSPTAWSMTFLSDTASLTPMLSVILVMRGACIVEL